MGAEMLGQLSSALQACVITVINCVDNNNDEGTTPGLGTALALLGACARRQIRIPTNGLYPFFTSLPPERDPSPLLSRKRPGKSKPGERGALGSSPNLCLRYCATSVSHLPSLGSEASFCKTRPLQLCHRRLRLPHLPLHGALGPRQPTSGPGGDHLLLLRAGLRQRWPLSQPLRRFWPNLCLPDQRPQDSPVGGRR